MLSHGKCFGCLPERGQHVGWHGAKSKYSRLPEGKKVHTNRGEACKVHRFQFVVHVLFILTVFVITTGFHTSGLVGGCVRVGRQADYV